jgi:hypothetical protein
LELSDSDIDAIRTAKEQGLDVTVPMLALVGDILLTNLKW